MFNTYEFLTEILDDGQPRHRRLCFLIKANGSFKVTGWGFISYYQGHQQGLEQDDAIELMQWSAFMDGLSAAGSTIYEDLRPYFEAYEREFLDVL